FVGPTRYGPTDLEPEVITSLGEFERMYGDRQQLRFVKNGTKMGPMHNYLWHAVRAFFEEGGKRLYVARIFRPIDQNTNDGHAGPWLPPGKPATPEKQSQAVRVKARFPGEAGKMRVRLTLRLGQNILGSESVPSPIPGQPTQTVSTAKSLIEGDVVWISDVPGSPPTPAEQEHGDYYLAHAVSDPITKEPTWQFIRARGSPPSSPLDPRPLSSLISDPNPERSDKIRVVTLTVTVMPPGDTDLPPLVYDGIALDPSHKLAGEPDSVFD